MTKCLNPECENEFQQQPAGRKQLYCCGKCRVAVWLAEKKVKKDAQNVVQKVEYKEGGLYLFSKGVFTPYSKFNDVVVDSSRVGAVESPYPKVTDHYTRSETGEELKAEEMANGDLKLSSSKKIAKVAHVKPEISGIQSKTVKDAKDVMTLEKIKALCPKDLKGFERSVWINEERAKYKI